MRKFIFLLACLLPQFAEAQFVWKKGDSELVNVPSRVAPVVRAALNLFSQDVKRVFGDTITFSQGQKANIELQIVPDGRWEGFTLSVTDDHRLSIMGSDDHGLAYGILEVSRLLGVSPWEWWADVAPRPIECLELPVNYVNRQQPSVAYRGIFINDEDWGMLPWSSGNYEKDLACNENDSANNIRTIGPRTNARIFELLLRLRANTFWPAMHGGTKPFFLTEGNRAAAEQYGIYVGSSHCEPMACNANGEWRVRGSGEYDYVHNAPAVYSFWEDRIKETSGQEMLYTLGMRGVHDSGMLGADGMEQQKATLEKVIEDQRGLLSKYVNADVQKVPQVFIPYKEVLDVYNAGLQVPDDVCLMWCDDNYGYVRHFPTEAEQARKGGNGIYYHVSYWGRPHDYLWLGSFSPYLLYDQMKRSYDHGIRNIWILNVGDLKPAEYQTELFLDMGWDMLGVVREGVQEHLHNYLCREFGDSLGPEIQPLMEESYRLAYIRKPEFMGNTRTEEKDPAWKVIRDLPWSKEVIDQRLADYTRISDAAEALDASVPQDRKDAFFELVKYPIQGAAQLNFNLLYAQRARHGEMDWSACSAAYDSIQTLSRIYNKGIFNGGKWDGIMDCQPRRLAVFEPITPNLSPVAPTPVKEVSTGRLLAQYNGREAKGGAVIWSVGLGYEGGAAELTDEEARYEFSAPKDCDSVLVELHFVSTHPIDGKHLSANVSIGLSNGKNISEPLPLDYHTEGRSEEWKENVLRNQAIRRVILPCQAGATQWLKLSSPYQGALIDQVFIYYHR